MATETSESAIRDLLATQLDSLEAGLELVQKEKFIPNELGTRGFIDLLAKDSQGRFVLIELKRSDAAAREAIHEVLKYAEGVKAHLAVREDEMRIFICSTEWKELLVPFSRFHQETKLDVTGHALSIDRGRQKILSKPIEPLAITNGRFIAPWHELNLYESATSLARGISDYERICRQKSIDSYVLVTLTPPDGYDEFEYILYFAMQLMTEQQYRQILASDGDALAEIEEWLPDVEEENVIGHLHEAVLDMKPRPFRDYFEIGYLV